MQQQHSGSATGSSLEKSNPAALQATAFSFHISAGLDVFLQLIRTENVSGLMTYRYIHIVARVMV